MIPVGKYTSCSNAVAMMQPRYTPVIRIQAISNVGEGAVIQRMKVDGSGVVFNNGVYRENLLINPYPTLLVKGGQTFAGTNL